MTSTPDRIFKEQEIRSLQTIFGMSILICTYNPQEEIFRRTLQSIESLIIPEGISVECIITDNNSPTPVSQLIYVREFIERCPWVKVITETQQGLTFARISGFQAAKNSLIVFIDDDNEVSSQYLEALVDVFKRYPVVGAWGPGNVTVEFLGNVSEWFIDKYKYLFQYRQTKYHEYGCVRETWASFFPFGTGLAVRREILDRYCQEVKNGNLCSSDRQGKSLSSGGDIQIVWEGIKMGYAAGVAATLTVTHLIPANRSNLDYIKRLTFGTASSYYPCIVGSFPEMKSFVVTNLPSNLIIIKAVVRKIITHFIKFKLKLLKIELAQCVGDVSGRYQVAQKDNQMVDFIIQALKLR